jgi:RNA polymerase sigma factor (sigma-70 family)
VPQRDPKALLLEHQRVITFEVRRFAQRCHATTLDVDDLHAIAQHALILAVETHRPNGKTFKNWLHQRVRWALFNETRRRAVRRHETLEGDMDVHVNGFDPEELLLTMERRERAQAVFDVLSPRQYAIISAWIGGATLQETATSLGVSLGLVHKERKKAFALLRAAVASDTEKPENSEG